METPPRTWGRPKKEAILECRPRNTPTHVGKTSSHSPSPSLLKKHPHARGEDPAGVVAYAGEDETPPRTWGRPTSTSRHVKISRNTPTHVGKTRCVGSFFTYWMETPPRTWGRLEGAYPPLDRYRNTPTHVGKTVRCRDLRSHQRKHPHARGEDFSYSVSTNRRVETPPRTWGRLRDGGLFLLNERNTPTHVGKTCAEASTAPVRKKHPHARGED